MSNHVDEKLEALRRGVALWPEQPEHRENLAIELAQTGRVDEAVVHFEAVVRMSPQKPDRVCRGNAVRRSEIVVQPEKECNNRSNAKALANRIEVLAAECVGEVGSGSFAPACRLCSK